MTRQQIRDKARVIIDEYGEEGAWTNTELNHLIDLAFKKIASFFLVLDDTLYAKSGSFSLTANNEFYSLPSDFLAIKWIQDADKQPIYSLRNSAEKYRYVGIGRVVVYYFRKNTIGFSDIPSASATLSYEYIHSPVSIVNDESIPDVPEYLGHELIAAEAAAKALDMDEETSPLLTEEIKDLRKQIVQVYYRRSRDFTPQVPGDPALDDLD